MSIYLPKYTIQSESGPIQTKINQKVFTKGILSSAFERAWNDGYSGAGVRVAILDTGIDSSHPDLRGKVVKSFNLTSEKTLTISHGTHVAGTIAANGWLMGGAPTCQLIDIKVIAAAGGTIDNVIKGINIAADNGASVINMSLGGSGISQSDITKLRGAMQYAWNKGAVCIAAAGNDGKTVCTPDPYEYPASINISESVAACDVGENLNSISLCYFSNENNEVDLGACGQNVISTIIGGKYAIYSGTSMATPHVTAMAALLAQKLLYNGKVTGASFSSALLELLKKNIMYVPACGVNGVIANNIDIGTKKLDKYALASCHRAEQINTNIKAKNKVVNIVLSNGVVQPIIEPMAFSSSAAIMPQYANISFGLGFLRYGPTKGPTIPKGTKYFYNGIFLGYLV